MTWRILITAPYFLPVVEHYRSQLEAEGLELIIADVRERLSEEELLPLVPAIHGAICGDDEFTARVLHAAPRHHRDVRAVVRVVLDDEETQRLRVGE